MKHKIILLLILTSVLTVCNHSNDKTTSIVTSFFQTGELEAKIQKIPVSILLPRAMIISEDKLFIYKEKEKNLFEVFALPNCKYLCSVGQRGQGPDDFLLLDTRSFQVMAKGFKVIDSGNGQLKTVILEDNRLSVLQSEKILNPASNGFYSLFDSVYLFFSNPGEQKEYGLYNKKKAEYTQAGDYPQWTIETKEDPMQLAFTYVKNCAVSPDGKKFATFYGRFKRVRIYDNSVKLLHDIEVNIEPYKSNKNSDASNQGEYYIGQPQSIGNYIYVICSNTIANNSDDSNKCELQVWDWDGNPVACNRFDRKISAFAVSEKYKQIYAINKQTDDELYIYDVPEINKK